MIYVQIGLAHVVLTTGFVLLWWRRDNLVGYLQAGLVASTILLPLLATSVIAQSDGHVRQLYANILSFGALAHLSGVYLSRSISSRLAERLRRVSPVSADSSAAIDRARRPVVVLAASSLLILGTSFMLMGFVPIFAADRVAAKYGVGPYRSGFERGDILLHIGLAAGGLLLALLLLVAVKGRRPLDWALVAALSFTLLATLSRAAAFAGLALFVLAILVERHAQAPLILAIALVAVLGGTLANELFLGTKPTNGGLGDRVAAGAPDLSEQIGFLKGFEQDGSNFVGFRPILGSMGFNRSEWHPRTYALRILTGVTDLKDFPSGGVRLPAPVWGYSAFGWPGVVAWSLASGFVAGLGASVVRRLLDAQGAPSGTAVAALAGAVLYLGAFEPLASFYLLERSGAVTLAVAVAVWFWPNRGSRVDQATEATPEKDGRVIT